MMRMLGAAALAVAWTVGPAGPAVADTDGAAGTPPRTCLQLSAAPEAPLRRSGREVRVVTYAVVRTLRIAGEVGHPAFFVYPHERAAGAGCELPGRAGAGVDAPRMRGRGDARRR